MIKVTYYVKVVAIYDSEIDYCRTNTTLCSGYQKGEVVLSVFGPKNLKSSGFTRKPKIEVLDNGSK